MNRASVSNTDDSKDRELLTRITEGDRAAFDVLYADYHRRLSRFLLRITSEYPLVEEIINDTMYVVWTQADRFRSSSKVSTWIMGIAFRTAKNHLRGLARAHRREDTAAQITAISNEGQTPDPYAQSQWLSQALATLPLEQRLTLEMAYYLGHSCAEIAAICDCPVNTVKTRLHAGRLKLKKILPDLAGNKAATKAVQGAAND